jgi:tRNA uridine 5-carboxymethylaminomethyl modification enzyme
MEHTYDVIVVGAGHAGCEAAMAAANMGCKVLLVTMNMQTIAQMSCNPAMGGIAKGQIVREIDALGGYSGIISDLSAVQFRMLNRSKGPAMWSPRCQSDRHLFASLWRQYLEQNHNIDFYQDMCRSLLIEHNRVTGITTGLGLQFKARTVVLTNGTFLNGVIHVGESQSSGGRTGERAATGLTEQLISLGFTTGRMKTGTPPRIDGRSIDYSKLEEQKGDSEPGRFSYDTTLPLPKSQLSCWIAYTNEGVHDLLREGFEQSPMFQGRIKGLGPRYCPSIEDKINRFAERDRHQLFVEPEGWNTVEVYLNGFSTSLPEHIQRKALARVPGFENAKLFRPGYAIEYDYFPPTQIKESLETKAIEGLYFAGQINGTTGYEEAACQGLLAGMNAGSQCLNKEPLVLSRDEAYIGVLINDLVTKGTDEPYRMFTSRAEYRILLRQDNADARLTPKGREWGLVKNRRWKMYEEKQRNIEALSHGLRNARLIPETVNQFLVGLGTSPIEQRTSLLQVLKRPGVYLEELIPYAVCDDHSIQDKLFDKEVVEQVEIEVKYESYIIKEREMANKVLAFGALKIPANMDYSKIHSLSSESREKLMRLKPETIASATSISGISPADIATLLVYIKK